MFRRLWRIIFDVYILWCQRTILCTNLPLYDCAFSLALAAFCTFFEGQMHMHQISKNRKLWARFVQQWAEYGSWSNRKSFFFLCLLSRYEVHFSIWDMSQSLPPQGRPTQKTRLNHLISSHLKFGPASIIWHQDNVQRARKPPDTCWKQRFDTSKSLFQA